MEESTLEGLLGSMLGQLKIQRIQQVFLVPMSVLGELLEILLKKNTNIILF